MFPQSRVSTAAARGSDHNPLLIQLEGTAGTKCGTRKRIFRFEAMWSRFPECEELVRSLWNHMVDGSAAERILQRQKAVRKGLIGWDRASFGHVHNRVKELENQLAYLDKDPISAEVGLHRRKLRRELEEILTREKIMWKQRGKAQWLKEGDKNTPFFHARASAQQRKNSISRLRNNEGGMVYVERGMTAKLSTEMNEALSKPFSAEEAKTYPPFVISESQSVFLPGRLITNNVLVAYELNHYLAHKTWGSVGHATLKLDLSKAYDRVEWSFLEIVLAQFGFHPHFISLIMGPRVSHLLFVDDTLIFCEASEEALTCVGRVLRDLEEASGLAVNLEKSAIAFSHNVPTVLQVYLAWNLGVRTVDKHEKYLGLPALVGRSNKEIFQILKDRVWKRL
ncbi:UNVERIFIED_CONTAM: hypothetical protein Sradi_0209600 [Sesamum radiatum]|uniref:Reverse transcriptase domain-containing protein n=1 Tax=Sesamum radiatum TaxID=300843 RepID=A0AAW2W3Y3_SESRA